MSMNQSENQTFDYPEDAYDSDSDSEPVEKYQLAAFACSLSMFIFALVGIFGNAASVVIFTRPGMRSSINVLLAGLSVIDLCMSAASIAVFVVPNFNLYLHFAHDMHSYYKVIVFGPYQFGMAVQTCSVFTFVLITIERYLAVCHPLKVSRWLSVRRARFSLLIIVVIAFLYNSVRFLEYRLDDTQESGYVRWLRGDFWYFTLYYVGSYLYTHCLGPFLIIIVLNVMIWRAINRSSRLRSRLAVGEFLSPKNRRSESLTTSLIRRRVITKQSNTTRMIVLATVIFIVCNTLPYAINVWEAVTPDLFMGPQRNLAYLVVDISNTLVVFNSAVTFILYLVYCRKYRKGFEWYCFMCMRCFDMTKMARRVAMRKSSRNQTSSFETVSIDFSTAAAGAAMVPAFATVTVVRRTQKSRLLLKRSSTARS